MSSELITHTSDASFQADVLDAGTPVLVDYWAEWCGPCKMIAPILDEVSKDYDGKLRVAKMNVDENRDVPSKYGIRGIPPDAVQERPARRDQGRRAVEGAVDRLPRLSPIIRFQRRRPRAKASVSGTRRPSGRLVVDPQ